MTLAIELAMAFAGGMAIAAGFCAALWLSLRQLGRRRHPGLWLVLGGVARLALVLLALQLLTRWQPLPVLFALGGFVLARAVALRVLATGERPRSARRRARTV